MVLEQRGKDALGMIFKATRLNGVLKAMCMGVEMRRDPTFRGWADEEKSTKMTLDHVAGKFKQKSVNTVF